MARLRSISLLVIGVAILVTAAWAYRGIELLEGKAAFAGKNYPRAASLLKPFGGWHDPEAEAALGDMYANGVGVKQDDVAAFALATKAANTGIAAAQTLLGTLYEDGRGAKEDDTQAAFWFRQAALQGDAAAETKLGEAYVKGIGVGQDFGQAASLFQQAADQADPVAQYDLGRLYVIGLGEPRDDRQAAALFQRSADLGNLDAQINLGILYHDGTGVTRNDAKAVALFRPAAALGRAVAEYYLGLAYENGAGVAADPTQAQAWLRRAVIQGDARAQAALGQSLLQSGALDAVLADMLFDLAAGQGDADGAAGKAALAGEMTPVQLAKAQALAGQWRVNTPLPVTAFEDRAPQVVYGLKAPPAVYQSSQIWFSRKFALSGRQGEAVFLSRPGKPCHGCGAAISVATFWLDGGPAGGSPAGAGQADFTVFGTGGVAPVDDQAAPADSSARIAATVQAMAADRVAILVPAPPGLGQVAAGAAVFGFALKDPADPVSGAWRDLGRLVLRAAAAPAAAPAASWPGTLSVAAAGLGGWPDIQVKATGTADELYRFNGKAYALTRQTPKG